MSWELFVNTLTPDDKYFLLTRDNLIQPIQMELSQKKKLFSQFFFAFSKSTLNFEHFQKKKKKMTNLADVFPILQTPKNVVRHMSEKSVFRGQVDRQRGKPTQTLLQYERQHRFHIK